jgi:hypothetical protein
MLSRLVLLAAQLVVGWLATPALLELLPPFGALRIFAYGVVAAVVVFLVGVVLTPILRDTRPPSSGALASAIIVALAGAALVYFRDRLPVDLRSGMHALREDIYPLLGAVLGCALKR